MRRGYLIEDSNARAAEIKYILNKIYGNELEFSWVSPTGECEDVELSATRLVDYDYDRMTGFEKILKDISDPQNSFFIVDLALNQRERDFIRNRDQSVYLAKTARRIVLKLMEKRIKCIITSSITGVADLWYRILGLDSGALNENITYISNRYFEGGNDHDELKCIIEKFLKTDEEKSDGSEG